MTGEMTTSEALDHTLKAYGRMEMRLGEVKRERSRYREALEDIRAMGRSSSAAGEAVMARIADRALEEKP